MPKINEILEFNKKFVAEEQYKLYSTEKYPNKKIAILTCMDTRLTELLPAALDMKNGDIKIIKNAGAVISHPFGSVMRSLLIAIYTLGVEEIMVIGHEDCGMQGLSSGDMIQEIKSRGISQEILDMVNTCGIDLDKWLEGFDCARTSVVETVEIINKHPLIPKDISVHGLMMNPETGELQKLTSNIK